MAWAEMSGWTTRLDIRIQNFKRGIQCGSSPLSSLRHHDGILLWSYTPARRLPGKLGDIAVKGLEHSLESPEE